jgi:dTDP-4-dehydrorhamnose reductase
MTTSPHTSSNTTSIHAGTTNVDAAVPKTKILITGASGYLGQHVLASFYDHAHDDGSSCGREYKYSEYEVYAVYHQMKGFADAMSGTAKQFQIDSLDLTDPSAVDLYFNTYGPFHVCFHLAALSSPAICEKEAEKALALNVPTHFLQKLIEQECFIIATSTDQVYGGTKGSPYTENDPPEPLNVYAKTKVLLEEYLLQSAASNRVILLRSSIVLGPPAPYCQDAHDTFLQFCQSRKGQATTYYTDECRSVVSVRDVVQVFHRLLANVVATATTAVAAVDEQTSQEPSPEHVRTRTGIYNMGGPQRVSRYDMALAVHHHASNSSTASSITTTNDNNKADETILAARKQDQPQLGSVVSPLDITMTSAKLQALVGFEFMTLNDIVDMTFATRA